MCSLLANTLQSHLVKGPRGLGLVREKGALSPAQLCRDQLSQMQAGEQRAGFISLYPTGPGAGRAPFQCPSHGLCGIKAF